MPTMDMPDLILHGTWLPDPRQFVLWAEAAAPSSRKGSRRKVPPHPFHAAPDALRERLRDPARGLLLPNAANLEGFTGTIWLPTVGKHPVPSPELLATGAVAPPEGEITLACWQISGLLLPPLAALDLLLGLAHERPGLVGTDLHAWRRAALLAMEVVAGQQVMPTLQREGFTLRAVWQPRPAPSVVKRLVTLTRGMPPLCRAITDDPTNTPTPRALVQGFLTAMVDATIRDLPFLPLFDATTPGGKWLTALLEDDPLVALTGSEATALYESWQAWARQGEVAGDDEFRVTFRLEPPDTQDAPWVLSYLVQATDDPSLLVPAAAVWREQAHTLTYLERRFERPHERMLRGLGFAARLFPPLEPSLRAPAPERALLAVDEAFLFLKEAVPLLEQSGFGVLVPAWWRGGSARVPRWSCLAHKLVFSYHACYHITDPPA